MRKSRGGMADESFCRAQTRVKRASAVEGIVLPLAIVLAANSTFGPPSTCAGAEGNAADILGVSGLFRTQARAASVQVDHDWCSGATASNEPPPLRHAESPPRPFRRQIDPAAHFEP